MSSRIAPLIGLCVLLALAGCNGDDDDAGNPSSMPPPEESSLPTARSNPLPPVTAVAPATESTTTSPSTTSATPPPTATDPASAAKAAVAAAIVQSRQDYLYAVGNYDAPDALDVLARSTVRDSPSWNLTLNNMQQMQANGWRVRPHPTVLDGTTVEGDVELVDGPSSSTAKVQVCTVSSGVVYKPGGAPDGSDLVVNDEVVSRRTIATLLLQDGSWKLSEGTSLGSWSGEASCPAA